MVNWSLWVPVVSAVVAAVSVIWGAYLNRRGQADVSVAKSEAEFRNALLSRVASLEGRVADLQEKLLKEQEKNLDKQREYGELQLKYEALEREVEELRPLKGEVESLRQQLELYEGKGKRK